MNCTLYQQWSIVGVNYQHLTMNEQFMIINDAFRPVVLINQKSLSNVDLKNKRVGIIYPTCQSEFDISKDMEQTNKQRASSFFNTFRITDQIIFASYRIRRTMTSTHYFSRFYVELWENPPPHSPKPRIFELAVALTSDLLCVEHYLCPAHSYNFKDLLLRPLVDHNPWIAHLCFSGRFFPSYNYLNKNNTFLINSFYLNHYF